MIRRACWLGGVAAFSLLGLYVPTFIGIPAPIVGWLRFLLPAYLLWYVFRPLLNNRPWTRLFALFGSFVLGQFALIFVFAGMLPANLKMKPQDALSLIETALLVIMAFAIPLALGTPSTARTAVRVGMVVIIMLPIHLAFTKLADMVIGSGYYFSSFFLYPFGLPAVKWGLLFAALAPDHIATERSARARKLLPNCEKCEYDLTGNVSGVCPECGTALSEAVRKRLQQRSTDQQAAEQPSTMGLGE